MKTQVNNFWHYSQIYLIAATVRITVDIGALTASLFGFYLIPPGFFPNQTRTKPKIGVLYKL